MKKILAILMLFLVSTNALASDPWTTREKVLEGTYLTLTAVDWGQTLFIAKHPGYWERNPMIGEHPSVGRVNTVFAVDLVIHSVIADALSHRWREPMLWATVAIRAWNVHQNHQAGIRIDF